VVQPTVAQARPSVRDLSPNEIEGEGQECIPRALRRRPAVGQNVSKKRKAFEFDGENGDEIKEKRKTKVFTLHGALIDRYSCLRYFSADQARPHMMWGVCLLFGTVFHFHCLNQASSNLVIRASITTSYMALVSRIARIARSVYSCSLSQPWLDGRIFSLVCYNGGNVLLLV